jgi:hypothetical protein
MADYPISNVPRRVVYAPSGTGPYAFTFEILSQTDIDVYKGSTLLTLTTDYTVTINANGTGSVTLVATAGTSNITVVGGRTVQRTTDFVTGGDFFANTLNDELDSQTIFIQQIAETAERGLKAPVTDPTDIAMTLPARDGRKGKVLAFDSVTGNPVAGPALDSLISVTDQSANINIVADNIDDVIALADNEANINTVAGVSGNVTTVAGSISNVNTVADDLNEPVSEINTVAVNITNVNAVGNNITSVNTVAANNTNINTVAGISGNVTTVAGIAAAVSNVSSISAAVSGVDANATDISAVNANKTNIDTVAGISANVTTVAGISANVTSVATNATNINTVATNITNVNSVGTNIANVNSVAGNATNINAVNANATNINTVAGISGNVTTVATNNTSVTTVAGSIANVNTTATNIANVNTVGGISGNVTTVAGISGNVTTVAGISANVTSVAGNATNINAVAGNSTNINTVATNNANVTTVATNIADVNTVAAALATPLSAANAVSYDNTSSGLAATNVQAAIDQVEARVDTAENKIVRIDTVADARLREAFRKEKATPIAPSLLLDFEGDKQLDPRVTFTRASSARYYNGVTTAKAEQNLLLNSVWSGAASGTPGTIPTSWSAPVFDGTIDSVALGSDAISNVLTLSATSARQIIQQTVTVLANLVYQGQLYLISNANSLPINQILSWVTIPSGSTASYFINGVAALGTDIPAAGSLLVHQLSVSTTAGTPLFRIGVGCQSNSTGTISITRPQLEQRSAVTAYTPTTTQPITNYIPTLLTATDNVARFDHNPTTGESLGLLIEEQRTNLFTRSEEFNDAAWTKQNSTIAENTVVAPNGTLTGDKLIESADSTFHIVQQGSFTSVLTTTVYAKAAERTVIQLTCSNLAEFANFDLANGVLGSVSAGNVATIRSVGNGWYRCSLAFTTSPLNVRFATQISTTAGRGTAYLGDGYSGIYIWGAQLEAGAFATSYVATSASQVTRSADSASMTGANFSSWYRADEGTLYAEGASPIAEPSRFGVSDGTTSNRILVFSGGIVTTNGTIQAILSSGSEVLNQFQKLALAYETNDFAFTRNGGVVNTDTLGVLPVVNRAGIGQASNGTVQTQYIKRIAYYPVKLEPVQLQALTS